MPEVKVTISAKKKTNDAFKGTNDIWYNLDQQAVSSLEPLKKGDEVVLTIEGDGYKAKVIKIVKVGGGQTTQAPVGTATPTSPKCEICGKELKDAKYKKCYDCNLKKAESPVVENKTEPKEKPIDKAPETTSSGNSKWTPDKDKNSDYITGVRIGCAFRVAGEAVSGNFSGTKPQDIAEAVIIIAKRVLETMNSIQ
ncbi:MAG: hypothetical protein V1901_04295 [Patescibacteria group bacterium]